MDGRKEPPKRRARSAWIAGVAISLLGAPRGWAAAAPAPATTAATADRAYQTTSTDARLEKIDRSIRSTVGAAIDSARADSLPSEPILLRALEGTTKGASPGHVLHVVSLLLDRLRASRRLLGPGRSADELMAAAGCLAAGIDTATVRKLGESGREESLVVPMIVLTDLVGRGAPLETAARVTFDMLAAGMADRQFLDLRSAVQQDLVGGVRPAEALLSRFRALPRGTGAPSRIDARPGKPGAGAPAETDPIRSPKRSGR